MNNAPSVSIPTITLDQAQKIIHQHHPNQSIVSLENVKDRSIGYTSSTTSYKINLSQIVPTGTSNTPTSAFLTVALPPQTGTNPLPSDYTPNSLQTANYLLSLIDDRTNIPLPQHFFDSSLAIIPYQYLLYSNTPRTNINTSLSLSLSKARRDNLLAPQDTASIDLQLGAFLAQIHAIQNDWFGPPLPPPIEPSDPSYSWQETFTQLLEALLHKAEHDIQLGLPYTDIRRYLARAIASFLFDDAEVPCLIWFTGSEDNVWISLPSESRESPASSECTCATIVSVRPDFAHALWGDPLLESFFRSPGPSAALLEGYVSEGGGPLIVFARQKTKRLWYTVFLALVVLVESDGEGEEERVVWAEEVLRKCVDALRDAPCY